MLYLFYRYIDFKFFFKIYGVFYKFIYFKDDDNFWIFYRQFFDREEYIVD